MGAKALFSESSGEKDFRPIMSKEKYLILKGCAGLGNRMYTLSRAIEFSISNNRKLYVDWSDGQFDKKNTNPFYDYFEVDSSVVQFEIDNTEDSASVYPKLYKSNLKASIYDLYIQVNRISKATFTDKVLHKAATVTNLNYGEKLFGYWYPVATGGSLSEKQKLKRVFNSESFPLGANMKKDREEDVVIFADFSPLPNKEILLNKIRLKSDLQSKISEKAIQLGLTNNCIGVHVRYTDKKPTKTLEALLARCKKEVGAGMKIFLATDNSDIQKQFSEQFVENLILNPKLMPEESEEEGLHRWAYNDDSKADVLRKLFEESIEDMWLLSECSELFYQGNSSFSVFSSIISKKSSEDWLKFIDE